MKNSGLFALLELFLRRRDIAVFVVALIVLGGLITSPAVFDLPQLPRMPVLVDALPDVSANQQLVYTEWEGHTPREVEERITYPLTVALLGTPGVETVRSQSGPGRSFLFVIFNDEVPFHLARSRVSEALGSVNPNTLPQDAHPQLGPSATSLGQVFWYLIEPRAIDGEPTGGWNQDELRSAQEEFLKPALLSVPGVAEVASIGGFVPNLTIHLDPERMTEFGVSLSDVLAAVRNSNIDVGGRTLEINQVEYLIEARSRITSVAALEKIPLRMSSGSVVRLGELGEVLLAPAPRRGILDKNGHEAVGGIVTVSYDENPVEVVKAVKARLQELSPFMPQRLADERDPTSLSRLAVVPIYDRTELIEENITQLFSTILNESLIAVLVVLLFIAHLEGAIAIGLILPIAVLFSFIMMTLFGVPANIMSLAGIALAIGQLVDFGLVLFHAAEQRRREHPEEPVSQSVLRGTEGVASPLLTAALTTIVGFLPIFFLQGLDGKLFVPLAFTKTFVLIGAALLTLLILPALFSSILERRDRPSFNSFYGLLLGLSLFFLLVSWELALLFLVLGLIGIFRAELDERLPSFSYITPTTFLAGAALLMFLSLNWQPLGRGAGIPLNALFVIGVLTLGILFFVYLEQVYPRLLSLALGRPRKFLVLPLALVVLGAFSWAGVDKDYVATFSEGEFLYMPVTTPEVAIDEAREMLADLDRRISAIPEVNAVIGKIGRADTPLDPAPISMFEILIKYKAEYSKDRIRQWRDEIRSSNDLWKEIVRVAERPGLTSAPKLGPLQTRFLMLQTGIRTPYGFKVQGSTLESVDRGSEVLADFLQDHPAVNSSTVFADKPVGKPYIELNPLRDELARHGITMAALSDIIAHGIGGKALTEEGSTAGTIPIRVRFLPEYREDVHALSRLLVRTPQGYNVPLGELVELVHRRGPEMIRTEDNFITNYIVFDFKPGVNVDTAVDHLVAQLQAGVLDRSLTLPHGVSYRLSGNYEVAEQTKKNLLFAVPLTLLLVLAILYFQFRSLLVTGMVYSAVIVSWSGAFIVYAVAANDTVTEALSSFFPGFSVSDLGLGLSAWIGFIALFGLATDDGVLMATYVREQLSQKAANSKEQLRELLHAASRKRLRPALMTTATTVLALLPVMTVEGVGSEVLIPLSLPLFGGMLCSIVTLVMLPVLYYLHLSKNLPDSV